MGAGVIKARQHPAQLLLSDGNDLLRRPWPLELMLFQPFMPQTKPIMVPVQNFDDRSGSVTKDKQITRKGIKIHGLFNHNGKSVDGLAHIGAADCQIDVAGKRCRYHSD